MILFLGVNYLTLRLSTNATVPNLSYARSNFHSAASTTKPELSVTY